MLFPFTMFHNVMLIGTGVTFTALIGVWTRRRREKQFLREVEIAQERSMSAAGGLCLSTIEALVNAIEAADPYNRGHIETVQRCALAIAEILDLTVEERNALHAAALVHNIGRLCIPEHILNKEDSLSHEEEEKVRLAPIFGARILSTIPFPWPVVPLVRSHTEHWDGSGYPDGLAGCAIPFGARILAVAVAYSAMQHQRSYRAAKTTREAMKEIEALSGSWFDPAVVAAFRPIALQLGETLPSSTTLTITRPEREAETALEAIAAASHETTVMMQLSKNMMSSLNLEAVAHYLLEDITRLIDCSTAVLFLPQDGSEYLYGFEARGVNERHFRGSIAQIGAYLTGRSFERGEPSTASFLPGDLQLRDVSDPWITLRSTLIVPISVGGATLGVINIYHESPDAFGEETLRLLELAAVQAGRAIANARRFGEVEETAYTDPLTGLRNARYLREFLEREINRAKRDEMPMAVLLLDLDNFKPINDQFGHARGDQVLREVAELLNGQVRNYDLAARYAGDEFVIVLSKAGRAGAESVAQKLKAVITRHGQKLSSRDPAFPELGISIGWALYPDDSSDLQGLLRHADLRMYSDKEASKKLRRILESGKRE